MVFGLFIFSSLIFLIFYVSGRPAIAANVLRLSEVAEIGAEYSLPNGNEVMEKSVSIYRKTSYFVLAAVVCPLL
jgi:hypothetical protein